MTTDMHILACPCCGQIDRTERVTAAYRAGLATGAAAGVAQSLTYDHGLVPTTTVIGLKTAQQSVLSQMLVPPARPVFRDDSRANDPYLEALLGGILVGGVGFVLAAVLQAGALVTTCLMACSLVAAVVAGRWFFNRAEPIAARAEGRARAARAAYQDALAAHERALALWSLSCYCARCDGVYVPGGPIVPVGQMHGYLAQQAAD